MTDEEVQRMIRRRALISDSGFRRFHSDLVAEGEKCFSDVDRPLDKLIAMVREGLAVLEGSEAKK